MPNQSFLDKTFNLAGALRRGSVGLIVGLVAAAIIEYFFKSDSLTLFLSCVMLFALVFAVWGVVEPPVAHNSKAFKMWLKASKWLALMGVAGGRPAGPDAIIPERITVRKFLWGVCLILNIFFIAFCLAAKFKLGSMVLFGILILAGIALSFINSLLVSFAIFVTLLLVLLL